MYFATAAPLVEFKDVQKVFPTLYLRKSFAIGNVKRQNLFIPVASVHY